MIRSHIGSIRSYGVVLKFKRFSHQSGRSFGLSSPIEFGYLLDKEIHHGKNTINARYIYIYIYILTMEIEISLILNSYTFKSEQKNQTTKNIRGHSIQVNSKQKRLKAYTRDNSIMPRILKIPGEMKHTDEQRFDVTSLSDRKQHCLLNRPHKTIEQTTRRNRLATKT